LEGDFDIDFPQNQAALIIHQFDFYQDGRLDQVSNTHPFQL
jgi:hypothetical protein